ncbi:MAG: threonine synthase [Alphaproteobacteria bacterium]
MRYISTRGTAPTLEFEDVLLTGLARDGGLYVPETWPQFTPADLTALRGLPYAEQAARIMWPFVEGALSREEFERIVGETYGVFDHKAVAPLRQIDQDLWLLELFHGPTLAFKDYALQLVGRLFEHVLRRRGRRMTVVGATSGDTGSAAIEACRDREGIEVFILHPRGRTSEVQRRQMTTVMSPNIHNIALDGSFDDCQDIVKGLFNDEGFRDSVQLSAVNSINWARIMGQIVYYIVAGVALGAPDRPLSFAVPTGNFGNIYAAYGAKRMGLPIDELIIGSNANDVLTRYLQSGVMEIGTVSPTLSPSMDIQISSNFERLVFDLFDRDGPAVKAALDGFRETGRLDMGKARWERVRQVFRGHRVDDDETLKTIRTVYEGSGALIDPHTAVGVAAAMTTNRSLVAGPLVALACAHGAKFPDAVAQATGVRPALPPRLADLYEREERMTVLENDLGMVKKFVLERVDPMVPA